MLKGPPSEYDQIFHLNFIIITVIFKKLKILWIDELRRNTFFPLKINFLNK